MSNDQMSYFYKCVLAVEAQNIDYQTMAVARVNTDKEGQQGIQKSIDGMRNTLIKDLIRNT